MASMIEPMAAFPLLSLEAESSANGQLQNYCAQIYLTMAWRNASMGKIIVLVPAGNIWNPYLA